MGICYSHAALLLQARNLGLRFDDLLTLGHQTSYLTRRQLENLSRTFGLEIDTDALSAEAYADRFFETCLGARRVVAMDYSDYEGSQIIHDMNEPVAPEHHEKFDAVIDGGTLEHIFNFPIAMRNCMEMVKVGGSLFVSTPSNNLMGHGFYQFSPELFFRIFQPANGFEIRSVILEEHSYPGLELSRRTKCYAVADPAAVRRRVGLISKNAASLMVHAVRTERKPIFESYPIQSDYASLYVASAGSETDPRAERKKQLRAILNKLPATLRDFIIGRYLRWTFSLSNRSYYTRWYPGER